MSEKISIDQEVIGGKPRVKDSRVSVDQIYEMYSVKGMSPEEIADALPTVDEDGVREAIRYAKEHGLAKKKSSSSRAVTGR